MESKHARDSTGTVGSIALIILVFGVLVIFTLQPPSLLESGSGMGNYKMPGSSQGGQGVTPPAATSGPGPGTTPSAGSTVTPTTAFVDFLTPPNDTADNPL
jgi:hypothetical protein